MGRVLISGYFGFSNSGDEAILESEIHWLKKMDSNITITVLSANPQLTKETYGVNAINRSNPFDVIKGLLHTDLLISGGGSLLQDVTSKRSILYYLGIIYLAKKLGKKVMLFAQGIGPVNTPTGKSFMKKVVNEVDLITVRDNKSKEELIKLEITKPKILVTADPVLSLPIEEDALQNIEDIEGFDFTKENIIGVSVRKWVNEEEYGKTLALALDYIIDNFKLRVVFIPMQVPSDVKASEKVASMMKNPAVILKNQYGHNEIIALTGKCKFVIGMRLHFLIFAAKNHTPMLGLEYDPKISSFLHSVEQPSTGHVSKLDYVHVIKALEGVWNNDRQLREKLAIKVSELITLSKLNSELAIKLLQGKDINE